tara:strand:- start:9190 stop:11199 length:2010 start_codon:yes stop_codon:yes gene_type:complete
MCGITGCYLNNNNNVKVNEDPEKYYSILKSSLNLINHRGPDDKGMFLDHQSGIALAHSRLSIIDPTKDGHQPFFNDKKTINLIFNGEIYNFKELRKHLDSIQQISWVSNSDTEVIMRLYEYYSLNNLSLEKLFSSLNGIFSIAIWDSLKNNLIIARDGFGVKPLYYSENNSGFFFASELKAILPFLINLNDKAEVDFAHNLDLEALERYLTFLWCPGEATPSSQIKKLEPGTFLSIKQGEIKKNSKWYYLPSVKFSYQSNDYLNKKQSILGTQKYLKEAVKKQMISDVPLGAFLSGGLDSSAIVAFAKKFNPDINCFTINTGKTKNKNDLDFAKIVANYLEVSLSVVDVSPFQFINSLENMIWQLDEPLADPACLNVYFISAFAKEQGIKVLLSGVGGDDIFAGYRRHSAISNEFVWQWLPSFSLSLLNRNAKYIPVNNNFLRRIRKLFSGANLSGDKRLVNYFRWMQRNDLSSLYSKEFSLALKDSEKDNEMLDFLKLLPAKSNQLERTLALEQRFFLTDHNLNYTDKMSMQAGVEVRVPFLDKDLVKFSAKIPSRFKQRGLQSKWVLKKAMEPYLPKEIIYRSKLGFGAPLREWLNLELREWINDNLSEDRIKSRGLFNPISVSKLLEDNFQGNIDASYTLLSLVCIEIWCKNFLDNPRDSIKKFSK